MSRNTGATVGLAAWGQRAYQHHEALMAGKVALNEFQLLRWPSVDCCYV